MFKNALKDFKQRPFLWIAGLLNGLAAVVVCLFAMAWGAERRWLVWLAELVNTEPGRIVTIAAGGVVLLVNLVALLVRQRALRYETHIRYKNENGEVAIALSAIDDSLTRTVRSLADVTDVRVSVLKERDERKPMRINTEFATREGTSIPELTEKIQQALKMRLHEIVQLTDTVTYNISLWKIEDRTLGRPELRKHATSKKEKDEYSFTGPQYPVDVS